MENYLLASSETTEPSYINQPTSFIVSSYCIRKRDVEKGHCKTKYEGYVNNLLEDTQ